MLIKTDKEVAPAAYLPCPNCGEQAECIGVNTVDSDEEIWLDIYRCEHCGKRFVGNQPLWCDPDTGDFYAYQEG